MQVPKRSDPHQRMSHLLEEQMLIRRFSEQEDKACRLIRRLSWGCGKEWCHIPHLSDFEVVGIYRCDIREILETLRLENVIFWNEETGHFAFNKMFDQWRISLKLPAVKKRKRLPELVHHNISGAAPAPPVDLLKMLAEHQQPVCELPTSSSEEDTEETPTDVGESHTNKHFDVCDLQTTGVANSASAKESILKKEEDLSPPAPPLPPLGGAAEKGEEKAESQEKTPGIWNPISKNFGAVCTLYEQNIGGLAPILAQELDELATTYELKWIEEAIKEAVSMNVRRLKYVRAILENWGVAGYKAPMPKRFTGIPGRRPIGGLPTGAELEQAWKGKGAQSQ